MKLTARQRRWAVAGIVGAAVFEASFLGLIVAAHAGSSVAICGLSGTTEQSNCVIPNSDGSINVTTGAAGTTDVNLAKVGGATVDTGVGTGGAATLRTAIDTSQVTTLGTAGTPSSGVLTTQGIEDMFPIQMGSWQTGTGGTTRQIRTCDLHANFPMITTTGSVTAITGVASRRIYICAYVLATGTTATDLKLVEGSDANCASNAADLTPAYPLLANDKIGIGGAIWGGLAASTNAYYVCINASAANSHGGEIYYTTQ